MAANQDSPDTVAALWEWVRLPAYVLPSAPVPEKLRRGLSGLWASLAPRRRRAEKPVEELRFAPLEQLAQRQHAPDPAWLEVVEAWQKCWLGQAVEGPVFVIDPPFGAGADLLRSWAERRGWPCIEAPPAHQLLDDNAAWLDALPEPPWVLPNLEACYLRHVRGLRLVRELLARLRSHWESRCVIGCDSWAWAYLVHAVPIPDHDPWVLQAFDRERLLRLLNPPQANARVRSCDGGAEIFPAENGSEGSSQAASLAALTRGNPGLALQLWRGALRTAIGPEEQQADSDPHTLWVLPVRALEAGLPSTSESRDAESLTLLHGLLLHRGLPGRLLATLLGRSEIDVLGRLARLERAGLVEVRAARWYVSAAGYLPVRWLLARAGYLVDSL